MRSELCKALRGVRRYIATVETAKYRVFQFLPMSILPDNELADIARDYGEDTGSEKVRLQCLSLFGLGGPLVEDDEAQTGFYSLRLARSGKALAELLKVVLPRFTVVLSEKLWLRPPPCWAR